MQMNALLKSWPALAFHWHDHGLALFHDYPRHEYFRRTLCNLIGRDMENGEIPNDEKLVGPMIKNICYANAKNYLAFPGVTDDITAKNSGGKSR